MTKNENWVNLIESDKNGGYSYGINVGLNYALRKKYDYYLVINNDTVVTGDNGETFNEKVGLSKIVKPKTDN